MFSKLFNKFQKDKEAPEVMQAPNLMAADPATSGTVNLMAADPINAMPVPPVQEKPTEFQEQPGIENQIAEKAPDAPAPIINPNLSVPPIQQTPSGMDAFNMQAPHTPESIMENSITSKICPSCGTPNDVLAKVCASCGNNMN